MAATVGRMAVVNSAAAATTRTEKAVLSSFLAGSSVQPSSSAFGRVSLVAGHRQSRRAAQRLVTKSMAKDLHFNKDGSAIKKMQVCVCVCAWGVHCAKFLCIQEKCYYSILHVWRNFYCVECVISSTGRMA
jgi:hypothetical protein